ncbi:MAG: iron-sulfur cluster assembly protein [Gammaproteobacteria bacterium]|jgi:iron-sulfur cluster assembly protein
MSVTLTERAAKHVRNYLKDENSAKGLRLSVKTTGCSGYMYVVETADDIRDVDEVFESEGIQLVIDKENLKYLNGTQIDFGREGLNEGFKFSNPNVKETCGCGESFSLETEFPPTIDVA